jgi:hypothetical protein
LKRKTKDRKFLFSQKLSVSENKKLPKTKGLKMIERWLGENQRNFLFSILKKESRDQKLKEGQKLKNEGGEN